MRHTAAEKYEIIRLVEDSDLPVRRTLRELQVNRSTFYVWYRKLPRQVDTAKGNCAGMLGLGKNIRGGTRPRLSCGRSWL